MSLYDGLTLVLSSVSTFATVYIGFRQLRQAAPAAAAAAGPAPMQYTPPAQAYGHAQAPAAWPAPSQHPQSAPPDMPTAPVPLPQGRAAVPPQPAYAAAPQYGPPQYQYPVTVAPAAPALPKPVRQASILLFVAAALQPLVMVAYYGLEYAINAETARTDFGNGGVSDLIVFALLAVSLGLLGIFIARGRRGALWTVWISALLGAPFSLVVILGLLIEAVKPAQGQPPGALMLVIAAYVIVIVVALNTAAILLLRAQAREFFFRKR
jgi:hypothetical protein